MKPELKDILQHYGVKGMKWGKQNQKPKAPKRKISIEDTKDTKRTKTTLDKLEGVSVPSHVAAALYVGDAVSKSRTKRRIAKAFDAKPRDFDKQQMKDAVFIVRSLSHLKLTSDGKTVFLHSHIQSSNRR